MPVGLPSQCEEIRQLSYQDFHKSQASFKGQVHGGDTL